MESCQLKIYANRDTRRRSLWYELHWGLKVISMTIFQGESCWMELSRGKGSARHLVLVWVFKSFQSLADWIYFIGKIIFIGKRGDLVPATGEYIEECISVRHKDIYETSPQLGIVIATWKKEAVVIKLILRVGKTTECLGERLSKHWKRTSPQIWKYLTNRTFDVTVLVSNEPSFVLY